MEHLRQERERLLAELQQRGLTPEPLPDLRPATIRARLEWWHLELARRREEAEQRRREQRA